MSADHWVSLLLVLIPTLIGSGGFIWALIDRLSQKQKNQTDSQNKMLQKISDSVSEVQTEVAEHTKSIQSLSEGQDRINKDNSKILSELDIIGDESRETMKANLLEQWEVIERQGYVTLDQKTRWDTCYGIYAGRGGNGIMKPINDKVQQMEKLSRKKIFRRRH